MHDDLPCTQGGKRHRVDERDLREAQSEGGTVTCQECGKPIEFGPRDLTFRASLA